jgi:hypothetical protein
MRSPFFSLTCAAGALVMVLACEALAAAADCCGELEESRLESTESAPPDAGAAVAGVAARAEAAAPPAPEPLPRDGLADAASYADAFRVLSYENSCSQFFGGPRLALTVLNGLAPRLHTRPLVRGPVGIVMSGEYALYRDVKTGQTYRLFDEAVINSRGPLFARVALQGSARMQVGRFSAETRQAKALLLLHEIGHLVGAPGGGWLLPNDGGDQVKSELNTRTVESRCLKQLLALGR